MPTTCTVLDTDGIASGNAVCIVGYDTINTRPSVARALASNLATSRTVYGVSAETKTNGQGITINVAGEVAENAISVPGVGTSRIVVSDYHNATAANQCLLKRIDASVLGDGAFVVGTCDDAGNVAVQPQHWTNETAFPKVFNVRAYGAVGDGITNDQPAFQAALNAAAPVGGTVYCGPSKGGYLLEAGLNVPQGVRLLGTFAGARKGFQSIDMADHTPRGSTLLVSPDYMGDLITLGATSTVQGIEIFYPNQNSDAAPDTYGWAIIAGSTSHSCSVLDVCLVNAYRGIFVSAGGCRIDNVWGWCIFQGILLGRCPDIAMVTNCEFNPNSWAAAGTTLINWAKANGRAYIVDGAEEFMFVNCFCWGFLVGCTFEDLDGDGALSGGSWLGGGFDTVAVGFLVISGLGMTGCKIQGVDIVPTDSAVKCDDNPTILDEDHKPRIMIEGLTVHNAATYGRAVWIRPLSKCKIIWSSGFTIDFTLQMLLDESPDGVVRLFGVESSGHAPRITNTGGADVVDVGAIYS